MKNDHLPIIQAIKGKLKPKGDTPLPQFDEHRPFEIQHHEIPGLPGRAVGEKVAVRLEGHIHSQHNDGRAIMHVESVKPDGSDMEKKQNPDAKVPERGVSEEMRVRTQQSHAG